MMKHNTVASALTVLGVLGIIISAMAGGASGNLLLVITGVIGSIMFLGFGEIIRLLQTLTNDSLIQTKAVIDKTKMNNAA